MTDQNYKNHSRYVPLYHFITALLLIAVFIGSIVNLLHSSEDNLYSAALIMVISVILILIWFFARAFALKAQDRAIRAEEHFRHYILTGKPFSNSLSMSQIIALRFASDEEFPSLAKKAIDENMSSKAIKEAIKNWKADHHRA
jgi:L-asparagine transporter-like permease